MAVVVLSFRPKVMYTMRINVAEPPLISAPKPQLRVMRTVSRENLRALWCSISHGKTEVYDHVDVCRIIQTETFVVMATLGSPETPPTPS